MNVGTPWKKKKDADLMRALALGKERAFRELVERHQPGLYGFALRFCRVREEAEDMVQETFLRLFRNRHRFDTSGSVKAYLYKVCRNLLIDASRKKRPEPLEGTPDTDPAPSPFDTLSLKEGRHTLSRALGELPENQRTAMVLRHTQELSYAEISEVMGLSLSAVESLLVRARRSLRRRLQATAA
ncbi:RNA polymerase sigma factor [Desulfoluna spongiiphila]|uniref:RNA polymerase sigma factor n=1 Tax=Desulfoluna spongiiphila TaxID=419481 RepID=UPI00125EB04C|nr:sigma-70 family RNA polymerase sigma factor [Desulfoluna spongiiphila]